LDLVVSAADKAVIMLEAGAREISEEKFLEAIDFGQKESQKIIRLILELQEEVGLRKQKYMVEEIDADLVKEIEKETEGKIKEAIGQAASHGESANFLEEIKNAVAEKYNSDKKAVIFKIIGQLFKKNIREQIIKNGVRPDGRGARDIRPIGIEAGILPRTHGSAVFKRGETQVLTVTTLGSPSLEQLIEGIEGEETKRYIHHYYMPPYAVGEVGRTGWPSRREVGHGALAERALEPVIPSEEKFPYTIRVVSEVMSSNGSTSMASVCGSTLSLMDAGVPIKAPVSGIAMGKVGQVILSDIAGLEDFNGDMDFKVDGTAEGITAVQLDVKSLDLDLDLVRKTLEQAREGRLFILEKMLAILPTSRLHVSKFAPKIEVLHVPTEKIGEIIGPGGKTIRKIISETGATVDVADDGSVTISSPDEENVQKAASWIKGLVQEIKVSDIFTGIVKRIQPFGAFVEILPGKEGLIHVSQMGKGYVANPATVVKIGQKVRVRVSQIDERGRINLSLLETIPF